MIQENGIKKEYSKLIFFISIFLISLIVLIELPRISIPLAISYILFLMISPVLPSVQKIGLSRNWASILIVVGILFLTVYPMVKMIGYLGEESKNIQFYLPKIEKFTIEKYSLVEDFITTKFGLSLDKHYVEDSIKIFKVGSKNFLLKIPKLLASILEWFFLVPLFLFFILRDGNHFKRKFLTLVPNRLFERFYFLLFQTQKKIGEYIFAKFIEAFIVGAIITIGLLVLDIRFAALFGLLAAVTNIIPYVGPVLGMVPAIAFGIVEYGISAQFGAMLILFLIANALDIALVFPILVSKVVDLHPLVVVFSVIIGSNYFGVVGMIISIPLVATFKLISEELVREIYGKS